MDRTDNLGNTGITGNSSWQFVSENYSDPKAYQEIKEHSDRGRIWKVLGNTFTQSKSALASFFSKINILDKLNFKEEYTDEGNEKKKINKAKSSSYTSLKITEYIKGQEKTSQMGLSTHKDQLAQGWYGTVYMGQADDGKVVKKGTDKTEFENEAKIGRIIGNHPNFMKIHGLYKKIYTDGKFKYKLLTDFVQGEPIHESRIDLPKGKKMVKDLCDCLLYLDEKKIAWSDIGTRGNIRVDKDGNIKCLDFGRYIEKEDDSVRRNLMLCEFTGIVAIMGCSGNIDQETQDWLNEVQIIIQDVRSGEIKWQDLKTRIEQL